VKLTSLGSGSSGNAFLLQTDEQTILLDCGVGARTIQKVLLGCTAPSTVILSHEHSDHVKSLKSVLRRHACEVVATPGTLGAIGHEAGWRNAQTGSRLDFGSVSISFVGVSHDAAEPCGFLLESADLRIAIVTDLGVVNTDVLDAISAADFVVLESNYDEGMLRSSHYPAHLKRRIRSEVGHLSNEDCAAALVHSLTSKTRAVWLSHLSHNNNTPVAAVATVREALMASGKDVPVTALARFDTSQILPYSAPPRQVSLFDV
jgi:phosphoribosyl 1,2-cyclic phosphodiesterase